MPTADGFVAVGNQAGAGGPGAVRSGDGATVEPLPLEFPALGGDARPYRVRAAALAGERLFVAGVAVDGSVNSPQDATARLAVMASDDAGDSWTAVQLPDALTVVGSGAALLEFPPEAPVGTVRLAGHGDGLLLTTGVEGKAPAEATLWRSDVNGQQWTELGTVAELFDGGVLDALHPHGDALLAFTSADGDAAGWRSDDGGATFERLDVDSSVFGGDGRQTVDAALTLEDGTLVAVGSTAGEPVAGYPPGELELWVSTDLQAWQRSLTEPALASSGTHEAVGLVGLGDDVVVLGTDQRSATADEIDAFEAGDSAAARYRAQDGAAWVVSLQERSSAEMPVDVTPLEVTGFERDVTITDVTSFADGLVATGWVGSDDDVRAAIWTSADGESWEQARSVALSEPAGGRIHAVTATDDGLVAVGQMAGPDDTRYLGAWTSTDGAQWTAADLVEPAFQSAHGYDVAQTAAGLIMVGTVGATDEGMYRQAGVWHSADGGQSWSAGDTSGEPFRARSVEVLSSVTALPDGRIVAAGHTGDAEDREEGGFVYTPVPYVLGSADGRTWASMPAPFGQAEFGDLYEVTAAADDLLAVGTASVRSEAIPGSPYVGATGTARLSGAEWAASPQVFRHRPETQAAVTAPFATIVAGVWRRPAAGTDALIGVVNGDEVEFLTGAGLVAEGDQSAEAAAVLGDRIVVLGVDTTGDESAVIAWSVTASE